MRSEKGNEDITPCYWVCQTTLRIFLLVLFQINVETAVKPEILWQILSQLIYVPFKKESHCEFII